MRLTRTVLAALCGVAVAASAPASAPVAAYDVGADEAGTPAPAPPQPQDVQTKDPKATPAEPIRDSVGDLNAGTIRAGEFAGAILIPGPGGVSFGIGGFIKSLAIHDTAAEGREAVFLPALLGAVGRDDVDGNTTLSAELSRLNFDARAKVGDGRVRGYVEFAFSGDLFKWRHGFLTWSGGWGEVLAGKSWSSFMDLQTLPDGLGEPTVSGAIFSRQAQFRYTRSVTKGLKWAVAIEDSASNDVLAPAPVITRTGWPDFVSTLTLNGKSAHLQAGGLLRSIEFDPDALSGDSATGWGLHLSGHVNLGSKTKLYGAYAYGEGLGRYLLGITPTAGAFIDPDTSAVILRQNQGGFAGIRHAWSGRCRSSLAWSYAKAETDERQPDGAFESSAFALANLLCKANRFLTIGVEYNYGKRTNRVGGLDNNRFMFGMQLF